jgi:hypothetical protein
MSVFRRIQILPPTRTKHVVFFHRNSEFTIKSYDMDACLYSWTKYIINSKNIYGQAAISEGISNHEQIFSPFFWNIKNIIFLKKMFILFFVFIFDTFCVSRKSFILTLPYCSSHKLEIIIALTQRPLWIFSHCSKMYRCQYGQKPCQVKYSWKMM